MPSTIGSTLKEARTKKSVSYEDVHSKIKIHPRVLQLLEEEKFDKLPSPLFVKSFLKSYADFLEVNGEELVGLYEKEKQRDPDQSFFIRSVDEKARDQKIKPKNLAVVAGVGAVIVLGAVFLLPPAGRALGKGVSGLRENLAAFYKNSAARKKEATAKKKTDAPSKESREKEKAPEKKETRDPSWLHSVDQGNFQAIPKREQLELEIRAIDTVWLKVLTDGKTAFQGLVQKGEKATVNANDQIEISTGNPDSMFWSLNGRSIGSPGKGVARKMMVTREGIRNLQPRTE
jgi:cytoskeletal protein RodZ